MKTFSTIKVGYKSGIYGCSGEYFTTVYTSKGSLQSFKFGGMYGSEERVAEAMKAKGFKENYISSQYGKMTRKEASYFWSEKEALNFIKSGFKDIR